MTLELTLGCGLYDRTIHLQNGDIVPEGIKLNFSAVSPGNLFRRQARHAEFDVAEFSLSTFSHLHDEGDRRFVGIPVFPSKKFSHSEIWINSDNGIRSPSDLVGRKIGSMEYQQTAAVWQRAVLEHDHGVHSSQVEWYFGGYNRPEKYTERVPIELPTNLRAVTISDVECLDQMLEQGQIDALMGPQPPMSFRKRSPKVARLFPNYREVETEYFRRTGLFPIMHTLIVKREIYEKDPWVAMSLYEAFDEARKVAWRRLAPDNGTLFCMLPWLAEHLLDLEDAMGSDPFAYGMEANRANLEAFFVYSLEQGMVRKPMTSEALFAPETIGT